MWGVVNFRLIGPGDGATPPHHFPPPFPSPPQRGGVRPFGVSCVIAGANPDGTATLYQTDPAGTYSAWKAAAVGGRNASNMQVRLCLGPFGP